MIHSLSGGVIADNMPKTFAKVLVADMPHWYIAPFPVEVGEKVLAPVGAGESCEEGVVLKVETCTPQTAPVPVSRAKSLVRPLGNV